MAHKKPLWYGVRVGRDKKRNVLKRGVFKGWDECSEYVLGVKGQCFKGFQTEQDAWDFVNFELGQDLSQMRTQTPAEPQPLPSPDPESELEELPPLQGAVSSPEQVVDTSSDTRDTASDDIFSDSDMGISTDSSSIADAASPEVFSDMAKAIEQVVQILTRHDSVRISVAPAKRATPPFRVRKSGQRLRKGGRRQAGAAAVV
ncbi:Ribonuclease H Rnh1 [Fusarium albosuccineum]|uniref:Ribonuclease H Rnh1 n=1 Tax=Fusarium albosuccineum TaxID=1237068 RepID=A0A8H4L2Q4_9HYPO|nr:Ribonuclease H Rnh1 [Fusarium albosuccineum]